MRGPGTRGEGESLVLPRGSGLGLEIEIGLSLEKDGGLAPETEIGLGLVKEGDLAPEKGEDPDHATNTQWVTFELGAYLICTRSTSSVQFWYLHIPLSGFPLIL